MESISLMGSTIFFILLLKLLIFNGLDEVLKCKKIICIIININKIKGVKKWKEKNRMRVISLTENDPQIHLTNNAPNHGKQLTKLIITVAAQ